MGPLAAGIWVLLSLFSEVTANKKYCWYFEEGYPIYFICRSYEECCGTRCCIRALSIQRLWYFWFILMMGILFCCGMGFLMRRRMDSSPDPDDPPFNVTFTRQPMTNTGAQQGGGVMMTSAYQVQPRLSSSLTPPSFPPPPAYCSLPPPPYEQVLKDTNKK